MTNAVEPLRFGNKSVLIADDDHDMRRMMGTYLRKAGFDVVEVCDGRELVSRFSRMRRGRRPAVVVVTDVEMPGMTGLEALRRIRERMPDAHVIVITSFADASIRQRARELGAAAVFSKPLDLELLRETAMLLAGE